MWKTIAPVLTGMSLFLTLPAMAMQEAKTKEQGDFIKKTVTVEIKGNLREEWHESLLQLMIYPPRPNRYKVWVIVVKGQTYELDFRGKSELLEMAKKLDGQTVVITGTLHSDPYPISLYQTIQVTSMKAGDSGYINQKVTVEIKGNLRKELHEPDSRDHSLVRLTITANGQTFVLDFGKNHNLRWAAQALDGQTVVVTGTLKDDVVTVTSLTVFNS